MPHKVWNKITYPFPNSNGCIIEALEWINDFTSDFIMDVISYYWYWLFTNSILTNTMHLEYITQLLGSGGIWCHEEGEKFLESKFITEQNYFPIQELEKQTQIIIHHELFSFHHSGIRKTYSSSLSWQFSGMYTTWSLSDLILIQDYPW